MIDIFHSDVHEKNVLIRERVIDYENTIDFKLCDFGTSVFSGKDYSFERHWRKVRKTILRCTSGIISFDDSLKLLKSCEELLHDTQERMKKEILEANIKFYDARIFTAPFKDYLEYLEYAN